MKRVQRLINKVKEHKVLVPAEGLVTFNCKRLDQVRKGTTLFTTKNQKVVETHILTEELNVKVQDVKEYLVRIEGEYVMQGEQLAERLVNGGLSIKRVSAGTDGIISFARLDRGVIDILGEEEIIEHKSPIYGRVTDIDIVKGVYISTECFGIFGKNNYIKENIELSGEFVFLGSGDSIYSSKHLSERYDNKIVFVGKFVYPDLVSELYKRGAMHVITYAINYEDLRNISFNITVLGGFGNIAMPDMWYNSIKDFNGSYVSILLEKGKSTIYIVDDAQYLIENQVKIKSDIVDDLKVGMDVRIRDISNLNEIGKVAYIENEYIQVRLESGSTILVNASCLDIVSY